MGRCFRNRMKRKHVDRPFSCGYLEGYKDFFRWLVGNGWLPSSKLGIADFPGVGRGIQALESLGMGSVLARIPVSLMLNVKVVLESPFGSVFHDKVRWDPQQIISLYLCFERHIINKSSWLPYLKMLPTEYHSPLFETDSNIQFYFDPLKAAAGRMKERIVALFQQFLSASKGLSCHHCGKAYVDIVSFDEFMWSWYTVNSRCVYTSNLPSSVNLSSSNNIALVPFVDMFNHSNSANVSVRVTSDYFELVTNVAFRKYQQVFINYGSHSNITLLLEYGFIMKDNHHDQIEISFQDIFSAVDSITGSKGTCSKHKYNFLKSHKLDSHLYIFAEGLSWNAERVITVICTDISDKQFFEIPFQERLPSSMDEVIFKVGSVLISKKVACLHKQLSYLTGHVSTKFSKMSEEYLQELLHILSRSQAVLEKRVS